MEAFIILIIATVLYFVNSTERVVEEVVEVRETKLNPNFYVDENAFMEVANGLGFSSNSRSTNR